MRPSLYIECLFSERAGRRRRCDERFRLRYEVVVCHMNVIRYFVARALQLPPETWLRMRGDNCGITEIIVTPKGQASLGRFADTGHLSIEQTTFH